MHDRPPDVLVIGGGNAALCAALTARRAGASLGRTNVFFLGGGNALMGCYAAAARAPRFDGGIVTPLDSLPFGIVNTHGDRSYEEGEGACPKRYSSWGLHACVARA